MLTPERVKITDVLDADQIETLLEQHDSYWVGGLVVSRRNPGTGWYVYHQALEVNVRLNPSASPQAYQSVVDALEAAMSPRLHERIESLTAPAGETRT